MGEKGIYGSTIYYSFHKMSRKNQMKYVTFDGFLISTIKNIGAFKSGKVPMFALSSSISSNMLIYNISLYFLLPKNRYLIVFISTKRDLSEILHNYCAVVVFTIYYLQNNENTHEKVVKI